MSDLKLTTSLLSMLERIERNSGTLLKLAVTASGGREYGKLNKLRGAGYVVKCDHPSVTEGPDPLRLLRSPRPDGPRLPITVANSARKRGGIVQATKGLTRDLEAKRR